jgi:hypothetical protein
MKYDKKIVSAYYTQQGLPRPEFEVRFHPTRKFLWDIAWTKEKVAIEVQGGIYWKGTGHNSISGLKRDYEKHNLAVMDGWKILYVLPEDVCMLDTIRMIQAVMWRKP